MWQNIMVEARGAAKLLTSWLLGKQRKEEERTSISAIT
jgi:hypothetical protein